MSFQQNKLSQEELSKNSNVIYSHVDALKNLQKETVVAFSLRWPEHIIPMRKGNGKNFSGTYFRDDEGFWEEDCVTSAYVCLINGGKIVISFKRAT